MRLLRRCADRVGAAPAYNAQLHIRSTFATPCQPTPQGNATTVGGNDLRLSVHICKRSHLCDTHVPPTRCLGVVAGTRGHTRTKHLANKSMQPCCQRAERKPQGWRHTCLLYTLACDPRGSGVGALKTRRKRPDLCTGSACQDFLSAVGQGQTSCQIYLADAYVNYDAAMCGLPAAP